MGWGRRLLKTNAKKSLKQCYWRYTAVCFLVAVICGSSLTTTQLLQQNKSDEIERLVELATDGMISSGFLHELVTVFSNLFFNTRKMLELGIFLLSCLLWILYKVYISNIIRVGAKRFFLETRTYPKTSIKKLLYLYKGKDIQNSASIMLRMYICRFFWWFTIVGGIVKTFEYAMIPFILAENPDVKYKEAFRLSKEMMRGRKMGLFNLYLSFIPWQLLGIMTMGITNIFYLNAYRSAAETEFYMMLRRDMIAKRNKNSAIFIDNYLENRPSEDEILINMFASERNYTPNLDAEEFSHNVYPMFLREKDSRWYELPSESRKARHYSITSYIIISFFASVAGWLFQLFAGFLQTGRLFVGDLVIGPWLPIVGIVSIIILYVGEKIEKHPIVNVIFITVLSTTVQYFYVWFIEIVRGMKYWDFSNYLLNIDGRICLSSSVITGMAGTALYYMSAPMIDDVLARYPARKKSKWCITLCVVLLIDVIVSVYFLFFW